MADRGPGITLLVNTRKNDGFICIQNLINLLSGGLVSGRPGNDAVHEFVLAVEAIGNLADRIRIAA